MTVNIFIVNINIFIVYITCIHFHCKIRIWEKEKKNWMEWKMLCASYINMLVMRIVLLKLKLIKGVLFPQIYLSPKHHEIPKLVHAQRTYHNSHESISKIPEWIKHLNYIRANVLTDYQKIVKRSIDSSFTSQEADEMVLKTRIMRNNTILTSMSCCLEIRKH